MKTINAIPEFRTRIRDNRIIEHDVIHPSFTVDVEDNQFSFCNADYDEDVTRFFQNAENAIRRVRENPFIQSDVTQDNRVYISCIPWISFTGVMHPIHMHPVDSVPRLAWGKYIINDNTVKLPYSIQAHHALADGYHAGLFFKQFQEIIDYPEAIFAK